MPELNVEEKREVLVKDLVSVWNDPKFDDVSAGKKIMDSLTKIMVFVGGYDGFSGVDKKEETLAVLELLLDQTDSPGPDFVVDPAIMWAAEAAITALYDVFKGRFNFDGGE